MKKIQLTQGEFAIVDDENYNWLSQWKWYALWYKSAQSYYAVRNSKTMNSKKHLVSMAREILGLKYGDKRQGDHRNHKTLDNRESNLRIVSNQQNQWNHKNPKGYSLNKYVEKYQARIRLNGKFISLGYFDTPEEAHTVYLKAKQKYHRI